MRFPTGGGGGMRRGGIGGGIGLIVVLGLMLLFGIDPRVLLDQAGSPVQVDLPREVAPQANGRQVGADDELGKFVAVVLADTEDVWKDIFQRGGQTYEEPKLVLFRGATRSACGTGVAQMGPFYCPIDQKVYIDLAFYSELKNRFRAPGDFAQAYVIAHEVGHHVQTLLGITEKVERAKQRSGGRDSNALQVRMELQADCLAGVFANHADRTKSILEPGDIDEALNAASAIGDDQIQRRTQGYVVPDAFTHGSSAQRVRWFRRGFESGSMRDCDTFSAPSL